MRALLGRPLVRIGLFLMMLLVVLATAYGLGLLAGSWLEMS
jgi:hypothetical protein